MDIPVKFIISFSKKDIMVKHDSTKIENAKILAMNSIAFLIFEIELIIHISVINVINILDDMIIDSLGLILRTEDIVSNIINETIISSVFLENK
tara:strand:+ start:4534 stop:4815 length:282 start_codon:yes stop_codon:yes gene_type:complete